MMQAFCKLGQQTDENCSIVKCDLKQIARLVAPEWTNTPVSGARIIQIVTLSKGRSYW